MSPPGNLERGIPDRPNSVGKCRPRRPSGMTAMMSVAIGIILLDM
jgi:hypothetical protein